MTTIIIPSSCLVLVECSYSTVLRRFCWNLNYIQQILTVVQDFGKDMNSLFLASISSKNKGRLMYEKMCLFIHYFKKIITRHKYILSSHVQTRNVVFEKWQGKVFMQDSFGYEEVTWNLPLHLWALGKCPYKY